MEEDWKKAVIITGVASAMGAALYYLLQPSNDEESSENTVPKPAPKQPITPAPRQEIKQTPVQEPALNKRLLIPNSDKYQARVHYRKKEVLQK